MSDTETRYEWAVRVHIAIHGFAGPHVLECSDHGAALVRLDWWWANRPEGRPELLRRAVAVTRHEWETTDAR